MEMACWGGGGGAVGVWLKCDLWGPMWDLYHTPPQSCHLMEDQVIREHIEELLREHKDPQADHTLHTCEDILHLQGNLLCLPLSAIFDPPPPLPLIDAAEVDRGFVGALCILWQDWIRRRGRGQVRHVIRGRGQVRHVIRGRDQVRHVIRRGQGQVRHVIS